MSTLVVDASALVIAVVGTSPEAASLRRCLATDQCHAPHLIDAEVGNVLRRRELAGVLSPATAVLALQSLPELVEHRYPHTGTLAVAAWQLRGSVTFYDALYVALAVALGAPLITSDARLSRAPKLPCTIELVSA
ncbi:MAG: type II toxin-antitoxin system VapC family toxin [Mycobacteriales bacterium]